MNDQRSLRYILTVPAQFKNLRKIREFVKKCARKAGFSEAECYKIQLAVDEACSNIIEHAYGGENRGEIVCSCDYNDHEIIIQLVDYGDSFDPTRVEPPDLNSTICDRKTGGLGLYFIHQLMDEVTFTIVPDDTPQNVPGVINRSRNVLVMSKRRSKPK